MSVISSSEQYLREKQVRERYRIAKSTLWRWSGDPHSAFPRPLKLGPKVSAWSLSSLEAYERGLTK
jgi:predicted DNA-binding transcriptional regulator AlpA